MQILIYSLYFYIFTDNNLKKKITITVVVVAVLVAVRLLTATNDVYVS